MNANEAVEYLGKPVRYTNGGSSIGPPSGVYRLIQIEQITRAVDKKLLTVARFNIQDINDRFKDYYCAAECITALDSEKDPELEIIESATDRLREIHRQNLEKIRAAVEGK